MLPVVGESEDLSCGFAFGDVRVGVDHLTRSMILGIEGQHAPGRLGAFRDVVVLQRSVLAVVTDRMEIHVEPRVAGRKAQRAEPADKLGERSGVHLPAYPVGVAARMGGLREHVQPEAESESAICGEFGGMGDPVPSQQLHDEECPHRVERREAPGRGIPAGSDHLCEAELDHRRQQREQPGMGTFHT
jgi:hypothetical protein